MSDMTDEFWNSYESNGDSLVNLGDNIDSDHLQALLDECDTNADGSICKGEYFDCLVMVENDYR